MKFLEGIEGFTGGLILVGAEIALVILFFILAGVMLRFFSGRLGNISFLKKFSGQTEILRKRLKRFLILICALSCTAVLGYNGVLLYRQIDIYQHTLTILKNIPPGFWEDLPGRLARTIGLVAAAYFGIRVLLRLLTKLKVRAKTYDQLKSNDESIERFFSRLSRLVKNSIWLLVALYATRAFFLPGWVNNNLFIAFKIYLIISIGMVIVEAATAVVDSLEAMSKKYWYRDKYLDWYNRLSGLMPLFRRCLEFIIYIWVASLVMLQVTLFAPFASFAPAVVQIISIFFIARVVVEIANLLIDKFMFTPDAAEDDQHQQRLTLMPIIKTVTQYAIYFVAFVLMLRALNINPLPLLAGAGILGIVVGMGAQPLINDIVSGFFILFESLYLVGDYIETGSARGVVESIHIRTSRIRDPNGQMHILRNGQINSVVNYSKEYTFAVVEVGVAYDSDLDHVFRVLEATGKELKEKNLNVLEPLKVQGLKEFGESELLIRTTTRVRPGYHLRVAYELREMIKKAFDREGIEIPFARRVVIFKNDKEKEEDLNKR